MKDLSQMTNEQRAEWKKSVENDLLTSLRVNGLNVPVGTECSISKYTVEINFSKFSSAITYYSSQDDALGRSDARINYASSGSFNINDTHIVNRTLLAAELLNNWDLVVTLFDNACKYITESIESIK